METSIKVVIVDDYKLICEAWRYFLQGVDGIDVVGTSDNAEGAFECASQLRPDIVLMDINLHGEASGFVATERICNSLPKTRVIGLSLHDDISLIKKFISIGAKGYLTKNTTGAELVDAIKKVHTGEIFIASDIKDKYFNSLMNIEDLNSRRKELTVKEIEIVQQITKGLTSREIGDKLFISPRTVETHRHNILKKLNLPNAAQLTGWAKDKGYV